jgi:hypothetical protein
MAGTRSWRTALAIAILSVAALAPAACGKANPPGSNGTQSPGGDSQIGGAPPTSPTATSDTTQTQGSNTGTLYPKSARTYAQEFLRAWMAKNYPRVDQLGNDGASAQVKDSVKFSGLPNVQFVYISCGHAEMAGFTVCVFRNSHGDQTNIKMEESKLGSPDAVTEAPLERTTYPDKPEAYAEALLGAYQAGNVQRVLRLSNQNVKGVLRCKLDGGMQVNTVTMVDSQYSKVNIVGLGPDLGRSYTFTVLTMSGGKPNAVKEATAAC